MAGACNCPDQGHYAECLFFDPFLDADREDVPVRDLVSETGEIDEKELSRYLAMMDEEESKLDPFSKQAWQGALGQGSFFRHYCEHALDPYQLSDGTTVYLSAYRDRDLRTWEPDLAVYLDSAWHPRTIAFHLGWPDFGTPSLSHRKVLWMARYALDTARQGDSVEIGCIGGHGRTGTFLAILEMLTHERADHLRAISNVRKFHCREAIESWGQERYLLEIECILLGVRIPPMPPRPVPKPSPAPAPAKGKGKKGKVSETPASGCKPRKKGKGQ